MPELKIKTLNQEVVAHAFNLSTQEAEASRTLGYISLVYSLSSMTGLHREIVSKTKETKQNSKEKKKIRVCQNILIFSSNI